MKKLLVLAVAIAAGSLFAVDNENYAKDVKVAGCIEDGHLLFSVRDDGCGFDPDLAPGLSEGHFGLQGIRERVKKLKGELAVESVLGGPTRITVRIKRT